MNSGDLTDKTKLILEERTALFINLAGHTSQEVLNSIESGISARKFYKILANVIIDWHWISLKEKKYELHGVGHLVWTPHRLGGLGQIYPAIEYEQIELHFGLFANLAELFNLKPYNTYGYRDTVRKDKQRFYLFPSFISFRDLSNSGIEPQEQHCWKELVKIYSKMDDSLLDALASSRTKTLAAHNLWTLFIMWERHMGKAINTLRRRHPSSLGDMEKKELLMNTDNARDCIKEAFLVIRYYKNMDKHVEEGSKFAVNSEFAHLIPCTDELPSSISEKLDSFISFIDILEALHDICREFQIHLELSDSQEKKSFSTLEAKLKYLEEKLQLESDLVNPELWQSLFLRDGARKETARLIQKLIKTIYNEFEKSLQLKLGRLTTHYETFLHKHYPLPTEHFITGN